MREYPQTVTLWKKGANDGFGGTLFSSPTSLDVRWEHSMEKITDANGEEAISNAHVWFKEDGAVNRGDFLYEGISTATDPQDLNGAYEVRHIEKTPGISGNEIERIAYL